MKGGGAKKIFLNVNFVFVLKLQGFRPCGQDAVNVAYNCNGIQRFSAGKNI